MANYFYNPCQPCCLTCGWGPFAFTSSADNPFTNGFTQTDFSGTPTWQIANNRLNMNGGSGSIWKSSPNPDPSGSAPQNHLWTSGSATMQVTCWHGVSSAQEGCFIGNGRAFYADWNQQKFFYAPCGSTGQISGAATVVPGNPQFGVQLTICIQALAGGKFNVSYSINGSVTTSELGVAIAPLTTQTSLVGGIFGTQAGQFSKGSLACGKTCPTTSTCVQCPGGNLAPCWGLNVTGLSLTSLNGNFCLRAAGCTLSDPNGLWTVTLNSDGSATLLANGISGTVATYKTATFKCNASNSFTFVSSTSGTGWPTTLTTAPTNCTQPPCTPIAACDQCSWPARWNCTIGGLMTNCPAGTVANPQFGTPPGFPNPLAMTPPECTGANLTCEQLNGTFPLVNDASLSWRGNLVVGANGNFFGVICFGTGNNFAPPTNMLFPQGTGLFLHLQCLDTGDPATSGLQLTLQLPTSSAVWTDIPGKVVGWECFNFFATAIYFCPFSQIECLQPVTLTLKTAPNPGQGFSLCCSGTPGTVMIAPA